jgi:hypothetical protein
MPHLRLMIKTQSGLIQHQDSLNRVGHVLTRKHEGFTSDVVLVDVATRLYSRSSSQEFCSNFAYIADSGGRVLALPNSLRHCNQEQERNWSSHSQEKSNDTLQDNS